MDNDEKQLQTARNNSNNANAVRAAANVAAHSGNPYGVAIGKTINAADKLSGGKAAEALGKAVTTMNKMNGLKGKMAQKAINKMSENGTADRISKAANAKNSRAPLSGASAQNNENKLSGNSKGPGLGNSLIDSRKKETEEQASDGGGSNFRTSFKVVKIGLIACAFAFPIVLFICLMTTSSQVYINSIGLGHADALSDKDVKEKIDKKSNDEEDLNREIDDENADDAAYDYFIDDENSIKFRNNKLDEYNLVEIANVTKYLKRKYSEASLDQLEDFYPEVVKYAKANDTDTVYDFFFKLYYVYETYRDDYGVNLDLPLLMATLDKQSSDKTIVFSSNLSAEDKKKSKRPKSDFGYCKDWSGYTTNSKKSDHDIEVLAQHMVSEQVTEYCKDSSGKNTQENILRDDEIGTPTLTCAEGETYGTTSVEMKLDNDKYKEFLKEFIEKKYYLDDEEPLSTSYSSNCGASKSSNNSSTSYSGANNPFAAAMVALANKEYNEKQGYNDGIKYINAYGGFGPHTPWCVIFVWYISANTKVNGKSLYPDIIKGKYAGTLTYMRYFNNSKDPNINFYYNDSCSNLKGKNGSTKYTPKPGDYIFFDWDASFYDLSSGTQDHTAMVEKYENGYIYTIEGNSGNDLAKRKYPITSCQVIGFGSWY